MSVKKITRRELKKKGNSVKKESGNKPKISPYLEKIKAEINKLLDQKNDNIFGKMEQWLKKKTKEQQIGIFIILLLILAFPLLFVLTSSNITYLELTSPVSFQNDEIAMAEVEYNVSNTTSTIEIQGVAAKNAEVTAYVVYDNFFYGGFVNSDPQDEFYSGKIGEEFRTHSTDSDPPFSDAKKIGIPIKIPVDKETGKFKVNINLNPDNKGDTWVHIIAQAPDKEQNGIELVLTHPIQSTPSTPSEDTQTTTTTETTTTNSDDYDRGYDEGYFNGVNEAYSEWPYADEPSSSLQVSDIWRQGFKDGYRQGYSDIQNDMPLQKPRIPGTAILDPRTGEEIYA